jgi:hypothetical protein
VLAATGLHLGTAALALLIALGLFDLAERLRQYLAEKSAEAGQQPVEEAAPGLTIPPGDGLAFDGWTETTDSYPLADPYGAMTRWWEGISVPTVIPSMNILPELSVPIVAPVVGYEISTSGDVPDPAWNGVDPTNRYTTHAWVSTEAGAAVYRPGVLVIPQAFPRPLTRAMAGQRSRDAAAAEWPQQYRGGNRPPPVAQQSQAATRAINYPETANPTTRRRRERKARVHDKQFAAILAGLPADVRRWLEWLTEFGDSINAIFMALPKELRAIARQLWLEQQYAQGHMVAGPMSDQYKLEFLVQHWRFVDVQGAINELAWETVSDTLYGLQGRALQQALNKLVPGMQLPSVTTSPGYEHVLDPTQPFTGPRRVWDPSRKQWVEIPAAPLYEVMQQITGRRERDAARSMEYAVWRAAEDEKIRRRTNVQVERARRRDYQIWRQGRTAGAAKSVQQPVTW